MTGPEIKRVILQASSYELGLAAVAGATSLELPTTSNYKLGSSLLSILNEDWQRLGEASGLMPLISYGGIQSGYTFEHPQKGIIRAYNVAHSRHVAISHMPVPQSADVPYAVTQYRLSGGKSLIDITPVFFTSEQVAEFDVETAQQLFMAGDRLYQERPVDDDPEPAGAAEMLHLNQFLLELIQERVAAQSPKTHP